jgi:dipeptidyl aminopeptidase/acylaminoacyl peptidase
VILPALIILAAAPGALQAQGTVADYTRARGLSDQFGDRVVGVARNVTWIEEERRFWYDRSLDGGHEFVLVDADAGTREPAFDHAAVAASLSALTGNSYTATTLPFNQFEFGGEEAGSPYIEFRFEGDDWRCDTATWSCAQPPDSGPESSASGSDDSDDEPPILSPDGRYAVEVQDFNVVIRDVASDEVILRSTDGSAGDAYRRGTIEWSPDSEKLAVYRVRPAFDRRVHYVESSPDDQVQPNYFNRTYRKPGDVLAIEQPVLFHIPDRRQVIVDRTLFPNAYSQTDPEWWDGGRAFRFEYNQRGHQVYRIIEVDGVTGVARTVVDEQEETFFSYYSTLDRYYADESGEIIWTSERDGWKHLYLYDARTGSVKNQITSGEWIVRDIVRVDEETRQIWFEASGYYADQDPYFIHHFRVNFDGTGLTPLTEADGTHELEWSDDGAYYVDTWSRVDLPPVSEVRRASDQSRVMVLEQADASALEAEGWQAPEPFVARGRDGTTDIWGVIVRPTNFDPERSYPVIEYIYAGPHDHFVPKAFSAYNSMMAQAELGFVVVQIDGMGTAQRSKAFHDVAWKNLKDAGFPDRILWHEAAAARYPWYDTSRVGIYGTSAGGQNSLGALLFHPDFYHVAVSAAGCHDNRMDKISWNEQWMGWPVGPQYAESSNVDNAWRLQGKVLLVLGELDTNVPPASTLQVIDALVDAGKDYDFLFLPGQGHTSGGRYGERNRWDYFVEHLLDVEPPSWNRGDALTPEGAAGTPEAPGLEYPTEPDYGPEFEIPWEPAARLAWRMVNN